MHVGLPHVVAVFVIFIGWAANVLGMRPAVWLMMAMGALLMIPIAGQKAIEADPYTFYGSAFAKLFGGHGSSIMTVCLITEVWPATHWQDLRAPRRTDLTAA